jgi:hypothetical protein
MNENLAGLKKGGKWQIKTPEETKITSNPILAISGKKKRRRALGPFGNHGCPDL